MSFYRFIVRAALGAALCLAAVFLGNQVIARQACAAPGLPASQLVDACSRVLVVGGLEAWPYVNRSIAFLRLREFERALADAQRAVALGGGYEAYVGLGNVHASLGDFPSAIAAATKAIEIDPRSSVAFYNRASYRNLSGSQASAVADYGAAIAASANYDPHMRGASFEEAVDMGQRGPVAADIKVDPRLGPARYNRSVIFFKLGEFARAIEDLDEVIKLNDRFSPALSLRGWAHLKKGNLDMAIGDFTELAKSTPAAGYLLRGRVFAKKGDWDRAIADYDQSAAVEATAEIFALRANAYLEKRAFDQAITDFGAALEREPNRFGARLDRGVALYRKGDFARAIEDFDKALEIDPKSADALYDRGLAHERLRRAGRAFADYSAALALDRSLTGAEDGMRRTRSRP
jgi:tetratricopeptide (TPR) repeat protein